MLNCVEFLQNSLLILLEFSIFNREGRSIGFSRFFCNFFHQWKKVKIKKQFILLNLSTSGPTSRQPPKIRVRGSVRVEKGKMCQTEQQC